MANGQDALRAHETVDLESVLALHRLVDYSLDSCPVSAFLEDLGSGLLFGRISNLKGRGGPPTPARFGLRPIRKGHSAQDRISHRATSALFPPQQSMHFSRMDRRGDLLRDEV
jgi:hypothetical protein